MFGLALLSFVWTKRPNSKGRRHFSCLHHNEAGQSWVEDKRSLFRNSGWLSFCQNEEFQVGVAVLILECNKSWRVKRCKSDGLTPGVLSTRPLNSNWPILITVSNCHFSQIRFNLLIDQFCVLGDILPDSFCLKTTTENLVKGKNVKRFRGQLNQQSNRKWSVRPGKLSLFLPLLQRFLSPKEEDFFSLWGRISCNLAFPTTTEGSGFNEKSKDQMLQAVVQSS